MDFVSVPSDRHAAHVFLCEQLCQPGEERTFQWRMMRRDGRAVAAVRQHSSETIPEVGSRVRFEMESIALVRNKGRRRYLLDEASRRMFIVGTLFANAGLTVDPDSVQIMDAPGYIVDQNSRFCKPAALFTGEAEVVDVERLAHAVKNGIGQGKAYGYGMLVLEEIA